MFSYFRLSSCQPAHLVAGTKTRRRISLLVWPKIKLEDQHLITYRLYHQYLWQYFITSSGLGAPTSLILMRVANIWDPY